MIARLIHRPATMTLPYVSSALAASASSHSMDQPLGGTVGISRVSELGSIHDDPGLTTHASAKVTDVRVQAFASVPLPGGLRFGAAVRDLEDSGIPIRRRHMNQYISE